MFNYSKEQTQNPATQARNTNDRTVRLAKAALLPFILGASLSTDAASLWSWQGSITYINSAGHLAIESQIGASFTQCDQRQTNDLNALTSAGLTIIGVNTCQAQVAHIDLDRLLDPRVYERIKWPGPVCLSCPPFSKDLVERVFPERFPEVIRLMDKFGIQDYSQQLQSLQQQYDLQGFETELQNLQIEQVLESAAPADMKIEPPQIPGRFNSGIQNKLVIGR